MSSICHVFPSSDFAGVVQAMANDPQIGHGQMTESLVQPAISKNLKLHNSYIQHPHLHSCTRKPFRVTVAISLMGVSDTTWVLPSNDPDIALAFSRFTNLQHI